MIHAILSYAEQDIQVLVLQDCLIHQRNMTMVNCHFFHSCFGFALSPDFFFLIFFVIYISRGVLCRCLSCRSLSFRRRILSQALAVLALVILVRSSLNLRRTCRKFVIINWEFKACIFINELPGDLRCIHDNILVEKYIKRYDFWSTQETYDSWMKISRIIESGRIPDSFSG